MSNTVEVKLQAVSILRGRETIAVEVPAHEVEVLRAVHGPANVRAGDIVGAIDLDESADIELMRMQNKYKRINAADPVLAAFPGRARDLEREGFKLGRAASQAAPSALVKDRRPERKTEPKADAPKDKAGK